MKYFLGICLLLTSLISSPVYSGSYDDCILKNMKGVTSDNAANAIARACYNKHKKNEKKSTEKKYYYKEVCTTYKTSLLKMGKAEWDDEYYKSLVLPVTNKSANRVWVKFYYAKQGSTNDEDESSSSPKGEDIPAAAAEAASIHAQHVAEPLRTERDPGHGGG